MLIGALLGAAAVMSPDRVGAQEQGPITVPTLPPLIGPPPTVPPTPAPTVPPTSVPPTAPAPAPSAPPSTSRAPSSTTPRPLATRPGTSLPGSTTTPTAASVATGRGSGGTVVSVLPRPQNAGELASRAIDSAADLGIPFVLAALVGIFLLIQGRLHGDDRKLTAAPLTADDALKFR